MLIGMYRFNWGKATRALAKAQLVDKACVMRVIEPLQATPTTGQFSCLSRW
jgi:hypothetical protein